MARQARMATPNLPAKILGFGGFDSSRILIIRGGILMCIGNFPEVLSRRILVGIIVVGRLGVGPLTVNQPPVVLVQRTASAAHPPDPQPGTLSVS